MLQLKNIVKSYTVGELTQVALKGVSLNFRENESKSKNQLPYNFDKINFRLEKQKYSSENNDSQLLCAL